jgi:hypothetical protein
MIWLTWRQFRPGAIAAGAALVALAAALAATRPALMSLYNFAGLSSCHAACASDASHFLRLAKFNYTANIRLGCILIMYLMPAVIGLFWGAPLIARELDSGTFRLAWSQSVTRARWATVKLVLIGGAAMLTAELMSLLIGWWSSPLYQAADQAVGSGTNISGNRFDPLLFSTTGIIPLGCAAFAFALGAAAGLLLRRTIPAMAVTLVVFAAIQVLVPFFVRPHLIPPVRTTYAASAVEISVLSTSADSLKVAGISGHPGAWILGNRFVGATGHTVTSLPSACLSAFNGPGGFSSCLALHGIKIAVSYQPASHYWELQSAEMGLYLVLAAGLGGLCYWAVRRRQRSA